MISSNTIIFACIIVKDDGILADNNVDNARKRSAIENSLYNLRAYSQENLIK